MKKHISHIFLFCAFFVVFTAIIFTFLDFFSPPKVQASGGAVYETQQNSAYLADISQDIDSSTFILRYKDKQWTLQGKDLRATSDIHTVILQSFRRNSYKTYQQKLEALAQIKQMGFSGKVGLQYLYPLLSPKLDEIIAQIDTPPEDARMRFFPNHSPMFWITKEQEGLRVDKEQLIEQLEQGFCKSSTVKINIKPQKITPTVTTKHCIERTHLRTHFATSYKDSSANRKHNVALALSRFNGLVLMPDEQLSFNSLVGARTAENGFREAKIILGGKFEDGVGGGVCQSSTTLYNAALLSDLQIVTVFQHSLKVGYVPPSFDAMVNGAGADLVIKNNGSTPVYFRTGANDSQVFVQIYGTKLPYKIVRESVVQQIIEPPQAQQIVDTEGKYLDKVKFKGDKVQITAPKQGLKSIGYLNYYDKNGNKLCRKQIRKNTYKPLQGLIVEGNLTKPIPPEPEPLPELATQGIHSTLLDKKPICT